MRPQERLAEPARQVLPPIFDVGRIATADMDFRQSA
jgi:hypothetical protein